METLNPEQVAWARSVGLSPDRAAFLALCPKYTKCGAHMKHARVELPAPNKYLMKSGRKYYFRVHSLAGKSTIIPLGYDLDAARLKRDALLAELKAKKASYSNV